MSDLEKEFEEEMERNLTVMGSNCRRAIRAYVAELKSGNLDAISDQASTDCNHIPDAGKLVDHATDKRCPRCNCTLLRNANGDEWCSFVGGREEKPCTYGLDSPPNVEELKQAAKEYARRYQDHSIDALTYLTRPATETLAESVFIAGAEWANTRPAPEAKDIAKGYVVLSRFNTIMEEFGHGSMVYHEEPELHQDHVKDGYRVVPVRISRVG